MFGLKLKHEIPRISFPDHVEKYSATVSDATAVFGNIYLYMYTNSFASPFSVIGILFYSVRVFYMWAFIFFCFFNASTSVDWLDQLWGQAVKGQAQGHTMPKIFLEAWWSHHSAEYVFSFLFFLFIFAHLTKAFTYLRWYRTCHFFLTAKEIPRLPMSVGTMYLCSLRLSLLVGHPQGRVTCKNTFQ